MIHIWKSDQAPKDLKAFPEREGKGGWLALVPFRLQADEFEKFLNSRLANFAGVAKYPSPGGRVVFIGKNLAANSQ